MDQFFQKYAKAPVLGAAFGLLLVLGSIVSSARGAMALFSLEGLVIVVGGVLAAAYMSFPVKDVQKAMQAIADMYKENVRPPENLHHDTMNIIKWARLVKKRGMRELEASLGQSGIEDTFVRYGLNMVVSEYGPDDVRAMMETAADACYDQDSVPVGILESMASHGPAFGMIGTLVGMVSMLSHFESSDLSTMGMGLAVAFLSTLYGVVSARMVYMPAAERLRSEVEKRRFRNQLITEGMVMLVSEKTPMYIQDRLNSFLSPEKRDYFNIFHKVEPTPLFRKAAGS